MCPTQGTVCQSMTACNQLTISGPKRDRSIHIQQAHCWKWLCSRLTGALHCTYSKLTVGSGCAPGSQVPYIVHTAKLTVGSGCAPGSQVPYIVHVYSQAHCWKWLCSRLTGALHCTYSHAHCWKWLCSRLTGALHCTCIQQAHCWKWLCSRLTGALHCTCIQQAHCWKWLCSRLTGALHRTYFTVSKVAAEQTLCFQDAPQSICERDKEHMPLYICICTSKYCKIGPIKRCKL